MVARLSAAAALSYAALIVLVFVTSRYRLPVLPPLAVVAGGCLALALDRQRPWSRIVPLGLALVAAVPVARAEMPTNWPAWWTAVGNQHITSGRAGEAEMAFRRAEQLVPGFPQVQEGLGMAAEAQGRTVEAMQHYRREMQSHDSPFSRYRLAALLHEAGQSAEAAELLEPVVGRFDDASLLYGQSLVAAGELERARDHLVRRRQAGEFDGDHRYLLALVQVMRGDPAAAEAFEGMPDEERWRRLRQLFVARSSSAETADGRSE